MKDPDGGANDINGDGTFDLSDSIYVLQFLFLGGPPPCPISDLSGLDCVSDGQIGTLSFTVDPVTGVVEVTCQPTVGDLNGRDLEPRDLAIAPSVATVGERLQYTFTLANNGMLSAGAFTYGLYLSGDSVVEQGADVLLQQVEVNGLAGTSTIPVGGRVTIPVGSLGGPHFLGVIIDNGEVVTELEESNNISVVSVEILEQCPSDIAEPNDTRAEAVDLVAVIASELWLCPEDQDWFTLDVDQGVDYTIDASFTATGGDLDLFVYDTAQLLVAEGASVGNDESVSFTAPAGGLVYVQADGFGSATNFSYELSLTQN